MHPFVVLCVHGTLESTTTLHEVLSVNFNVCIFNLVERCVKFPILK